METKIANDWVKTADHLCRKRPLYRLRHNHCPIFTCSSPFDCKINFQIQLGETLATFGENFAGFGANFGENFAGFGATFGETLATFGENLARFGEKLITWFNVKFISFSARK